MKRLSLSVSPARLSLLLCLAVAFAYGVVPAHAQREEHGRKYKPLPPTAHIVVKVEKAFNGKPLINAAVVFHAVRDGQNDGNLEVKTDPEGNATIDVIEVGSQVTVQVIADGFATFAGDLNVDGPEKTMLVKMLRPREQVSAFEPNTDAPAQVKPGVQEHIVPKPAATKPAATPPAATPPAAAPPNAAATAAKPQ